MEIRPLHLAFGAEIRGIDWARDVSPRHQTELRDALDRYQLLLLAQTAPLAPERQVALASVFGTPVDNGGGRLWSVLRNDEDAGAIKLPFHLDFSYTDAPIKVISLYAQELPKAGTTTSFVSNVANWASLPAELQAQLAPLHLRHRHISALAGDWPEFIADHPVCRPHPRSGRPMLFVTEHHAHRILELDDRASAALLAQLFTHSYAEARVYTHRWQPNDLLIWDNLAAQHARREAADPAAGTRAMRRVVINDVAFPELLARAQQQATASHHGATLITLDRTLAEAGPALGVPTHLLA